MPMTRHSVGQLVINSLASRLGISMTLDRPLDGFIGHTTTTFGEHPVSVTLFKSRAFMNVSGPSVSKALRQTVQSSNSMIVIHSSISHKREQLSYRFGGSADGHNGVKSVVSAIGGHAGFHRLRIGIGREDGPAREYVLWKLTSHERQFWGENGEGIDVVLSEIERIVGNLGH